MSTDPVLALATVVVLAVSLFDACTTPRDEAGSTSAGLYYELSGAGEPVVLIHGFSLDRRMWDRQVSVLKADYSVICYDLRGHGLSAEPTEPYTAHEDLLTVYQAVGVGKAVLVGLSAGAEVALDFALAYPGRVTRLVLASPGVSGYTLQGPFDWMAPVVAALQGGDAEAATRSWIETPLMRIANDPKADSVMREIVLSNWDIWTYSRELQKPLTPPAIGRLSDISVPTLVVVGELDLPDTQRAADILATSIEGAEKITIPGVGHLTNLAAPDAFNLALLRFLKDKGSTGNEAPWQLP